MISSSAQYHSKRFNDISALETAVLGDPNLASPPLSPESASTHLGLKYTEQYVDQRLYRAPLITQFSSTERSSETDNEQPLHIQVNGIPNSGVQSRVETQIKLSISLRTKHGKNVSDWSYIRISESLLTKFKQRKNRFAATMISDDSKVLELDARVVCETNEDKKIEMCQGCVRRERKRAGRKKSANLSNYNMDTKEAFELDRKRILLLNCRRLTSFDTGEATVPTRITCYCRHHNEPIGFRVRFTLRNNQGLIIATGQSPPIMVSDSYKRSKERVRSMSDAITKRNAITTDAEKVAYTTLSTPISSRKNSACNIDLMNVTQTSSSELHSVPPIVGNLPLSPDEASLSFNAIPNNNVTAFPSTPGLVRTWQDMTINTVSYGQFQLPLTFRPNLHHCRTETNMTSLSPPIKGFSSGSRKLQQNDTSCSIKPVKQPYSAEIITTASSISNSPIITKNRHIAAKIPILDRIEPSFGPTMGGIEIAILGQNFDVGPVVMFGDCTATTIFYNSNIIICLLPSTDKPGPVALSFKDHSFLRNCPEPSLFCYFETCHQDIIDLAFESSSCKSLNGAVKQQLDLSHPRHIEMEVMQILVQRQFMNETRLNRGGQNLLHLAAHLNYGELARFLIKCSPSMVHAVDRNGLTPLHFACQSKSTSVIEILLRAGAHVDAISNCQFLVESQ